MNKTEKIINRIRIFLSILAILQIIATVIMLVNPIYNIIEKIINIAIIFLFIITIKGLMSYENYGLILSIIIGLMYIAMSVTSFNTLTSVTRENIISYIPLAVKAILGILIILESLRAFFRFNKTRLNNSNDSDISNKIKNIDDFENRMEKNINTVKSAEQLEFETYNKKDKEK